MSTYTYTYTCTRTEINRGLIIPMYFVFCQEGNAGRPGAASHSLVLFLHIHMYSVHTCTCELEDIKRPNYYILSIIILFVL